MPDDPPRPNPPDPPQHPHNDAESERMLVSERAWHLAQKAQGNRDSSPARSISMNQLFDDKKTRRGREKHLFYWGICKQSYAEIKRLARNIRQTKKYKEKSREFKKDKACACCGQKNDLFVHHFSKRNYEDITEENAVVLCRGCHYLVHRGMDLSWIESHYKNHPKRDKERGAA